MAGKCDKGDWWNADIVGQIRDMRDARTYTKAEQTKLADLLDAAGCPEVEHATNLRGGLSKWRAARELALILGGVYQEAVWELDAVAEKMDRRYSGRGNTEYDFDWLVEAIHDNVVNGEYYTFDFSTPDELEDNEDRLKKCFTTITGITEPEDDGEYRPGVFSCSC